MTDTRAFMAKISEQIRSVEGLAEAVVKESQQEFVSRMQTPHTQGGHMRIDTGFLRASLVPVVNGGPPGARGNPDRNGSFGYDDGDITLAIANAEITDEVSVWYTANYARYVNERFRFLDLTAQQWRQIVDEKAAEAKARFGL